MELWLLAVLWDLECPDLALFSDEDQARTAALDYLREHFDDDTIDELITERDDQVVPLILKPVRVRE